MRTQRIRPVRRTTGLLAGCAVLATASLLTPPTALATAELKASTTAPGAAANAPIADLSLSAGRLSYIDTSIADDAQGSVWQRTAERDRRHRPVLGAAARLLAISPATGRQALANRRPVLSTSAGRAVVQQLAALPTTLLPYAIVDRGRITQTFNRSARNGFRVRASGPYTLIERRVHRMDGTVALDLSAQAVHTDLYGASVIYSKADGSVRVRNLSQPTSASNPRSLAPARCDAGCASQVAIWGTTVAWSRLDSALVVRTLPATKVRVIKPLTNVFDLRLSEGVLSWHTSEDSLNVVNLRAARSSPQAIALTGAEVDDHLVAGITGSGALSVQALPFGQSTAYRPRLIGGLGSAGFSPDGDGVRDVWVPQFDLSKPVSSVLIRISRGSEVVRTLTATALDGSVRDLAWTGRDEFGVAVPAGNYSWRLTAKAVDGNGTLTAVNGASPATGTITLTR